MTETNDDAKKARDAAMAQVDQNASTAWKAFVYECIAIIARQKQIFTTDDVERLRKERGGPTTHEPRALGPLMMNARRNGLCKPTDKFMNSTQPVCHARPMRVWKSLMFGK